MINILARKFRRQETSFFAALVLLAGLALPVWQQEAAAAVPTLTTPSFENAGANMATLVLQSNTTGTGYFTLLAGSNQPCGSGTQVRSGVNSAGVSAPYRGSLPLTANTAGRYTVRNLTKATTYTVCFTADDSPVANGSNLQATPAKTNLTTPAGTVFADPDWNVVGSAGFSAGMVYFTSLAFAPDGTPYIAYQDEVNGYKATVMKYNGSAWSAVGSAGFSAGMADDVSLAFAPDGTPYVAYTDYANLYKATVMKFNGTAWVGVGSGGISVADAWYTTLAFAPDGAPHVAYQDGSVNSRATIMRFNGTSWIAVGSAGFTTGAVDSPSLAFSADGFPVLAYGDVANGNKAKVMKYFLGSSWSTLGNAGFSTAEISNPSLAIAPDGTPHVAYTDGANGNKTTVMKYSGGWVPVGSAGFSAADAWYPSLAFATDGAPHVVYQDGATNYRATVKKYSSSSWVTVGSAGFSSADVLDISLAFAPDGTPYVAYQDGGNSSMATVMKLKDKTATTTAVIANVNPSAYGQTVTFTATTTPAAASGTVTFKDGATSLGSAAISGGTAFFSTSTLASGSHAITAVYAGDGNYSASTSAILSQTVSAASSTVTLTPPVVENPGAYLATLVLQSNGTGSGYFTLLAGNGANCGTGLQVKAGLDSNGAKALYRGSLPLTANTAARYTVRNLLHNSAYTVCFTADSPNDLNLQPAPLKAGFSTATATAVTSASWGVVGSAGFSAGQVDYTSLAFAPDGTPYLAYKDSVNGNKAAVMKFSNGSWSQAGSAGFSAGQADYLSLAFAPDGTPYVAYKDGGNGSRATVMKFSGGVWTAVGSVGFSAGLIDYLSLAFAPDGTPHIAYRDSANDYKATVMKFNGTAWVPVGSAGFSPNAAAYLSLAFATDGTPYLAYGGTSSKATVMTYDGAAWITVGAAEFSDVNAVSTSLAIAPDGTLYVAYTDSAYSSRTVAKKYTGTAWVTVGSAGFSTNPASYPSLAFAPDGAPHIAYREVANNSKATVMKYNGTAWVAVGSAGFSAGQTKYTSLAFNAEGIPYVAYQDGVSLNKATVMKLMAPSAATAAATSVTASGATLNGTANDNGATTSVSFDYGVTTAYGTTVNATTGRSIIAGSGSTAAAVTISGLACSTTYHFRVKAVNSYATAYGSDRTFTTSLCTQSITFNAPATHVLGDADFDPGATASSGLPVNYSSSNTGVATIVNNKVHLLAAGTTNITASQAGNPSYAAAANVIRTLTVVLPPSAVTSAASGITVSGATLNGTVNGNTVTTTVSFDYGLTTGYGTNLAATTGASGSGSRSVAVTIGSLACGTVYHFRVKATNSYATTYGSDGSFTTTKCPQTITFNTLATHVLGEADFDPGATASSGLPVSYSSSNTAVATIVNNRVHLVSAGTATITAIQAGNATWGVATSVPRTLTVYRPNTLTVSLLGTGGGAVNSSNPVGTISCVSGSSSGCSHTYTGVSQVTLGALADWKSTFTGWGVPCSGTGSCLITLNGDAGVSAQFSIIPRVRVAGTVTKDYACFQDAYDNAVSGNLLKAKVYTFPENVVFDKNMIVTLDGGSSDNFASTIGVSTLSGSLTVTQGKVTIRNLIIK